MSNSEGDEVGDAISSSLRAYMSEAEINEFFIGEAEACVLIKLLGRIGSENDALLVTTAPYDDYRVEPMGFGKVATLICSMLTLSRDLRVFGSSWAVGLSSYSSDPQSEEVVEIATGNFEMKISLAGTARSWLQHP